MLLSKETVIQLNDAQSNIIGHMQYAAWKLWNVCNYERKNYKTLSLTEFPDWYYQKKAHKNDIWYKNLPSQTAQEVIKVLDGAWKSFYALKKTQPDMNPQPPRFKHDLIPITYMQNGIRQNGNQVKLTIPKQLKNFMADEYDIYDNCLIFENMDIHQIKIFPADKNAVRVIVIYYVPDVKMLEDNGNYLSVDLGVRTLFTCYDNVNGKSFLIGREYRSVSRKYDKKIAYYQSISDSQQNAKGIEYPKKSKRVLSLYKKKRNTIKDYLHKCTRYLVNYCVDNDINTVVIGDIKGIRDDRDLGDANNQTFHSLPYEKIYQILSYKLALQGISIIKQKESYTSQCSPLTAKVGKEYASPSCRKHRGLYIADNKVYNADSVGAYNILRLYTQNNSYSPVHLSNPELIKVAV